MLEVAFCFFNQCCRNKFIVFLFLINLSDAREIRCRFSKILLPVEVPIAEREIFSSAKQRNFS
jgi:hypothetical protein